MSEKNFDTLLAELQATADDNETLAKALPPVEDDKDDAEIEAAAAEGDSGKEGDANPEDLEGDKSPLVKSMVIDEEEVQVIDAEQLVKSLEDLQAKVDTQESVLAKGLESALGALKSHGELIKSLQGQITKMGSQGTGRKAVLAVSEKPSAGEQPLAKSQPDGITHQEFMAKSHAAFDAGKITGKDLTTIDVALRTGQAGVLDQGLVAKVLS